MQKPRKLTKQPLISSLMRHDKARADALFFSIGEAVIATDARAHINRLNKTAADLLGFSEEELLGQWYPGTVIAEDENGAKINTFERPIMRVFMTGKPVSERLYYRRKNGSRLPVSLTVAPVLLHNKPIGAIEVFRDISQEITLEKAKDDFISIASHQLRTPATGVKQYIGMILEGYTGGITDEQHSLLTRAYASNERQLKIIDDLLRIARIDAGHIRLQVEQVDIIQLLKDVVFEQLKKIKDHGQTLKFANKAEKAILEIDAARIRMVFENLIDNASKYTTSGKTIRIAVKQQIDSVAVSIQDEGVGISKSDLDKLFQKFSRLDHKLSQMNEGSGLGLYWAKKIVDLHDGTIEVNSKRHKGSVFTVILPHKPVKINDDVLPIKGKPVI